MNDDPTSIKPYFPTFEAACETIINNPDNNLVNLNLDNVCLGNLYQNRDQLSLNRPVHIPLAKWSNALRNHIVRKVKKEKKKMDSAQAKQAEAMAVAVAKEQAKEHAMDMDLLKILLDGVICHKKRMEIYDGFYAKKANAKREEHNMQMEMEEKQTDNHIKRERIEVEKEVNVQKTEAIQGFISSHGKPLRRQSSYGEDRYDEKDYDHDYDYNHDDDHNHDDRHYEQIENPGTNFFYYHYHYHCCCF
jgi:hypothetical protein